MKEKWIKVSDQLPDPHDTVLAKCTNGDIYQARVCYGMHEPFWCGHSKLNFGVIFNQHGLEVDCWTTLKDD